MNRVRSVSRRAIIAELSGEAFDWEHAYRGLLPKVYRFFAYRVGDRHVAEDLTSATFERAWKGRAGYVRSLGAIESWLFGIARNVAADYFRHLKPSLDLSQAAGKAADGPVEEIIERRSEFERLSRLLQELPSREREIVSLKYGAGLTNRAVASLTGLTETNVGTILHRIVARLRGRWEEYS